jgi:peptidylprolyl isomerase/FKBP-type peptidyl-prolyl cis-trans isomerase FklB
VNSKTVATALAVALACASPGWAETAAALGAGTTQEQAFLARNAKAEGVVALPGLQYKVVRSGPATGLHPRRADDITVRYVGQFIDGKTFGASSDNGAGSETFPVQKLIPGWIAALQLMRPGDVWLLYIPAYLAYGATGKSYIPPDSTLIFQVELVSVTPEPEAPAR